MYVSEHVFICSPGACPPPPIFPEISVYSVVVCVRDKRGGAAGILIILIELPVDVPMSIHCLDDEIRHYR